MPRRAAASRSMLSSPVPTLATILQAGIAASTASLTSWTVTMTASASSSSPAERNGNAVRWRTVIAHSFEQAGLQRRLRALAVGDDDGGHR